MSFHSIGPGLLPCLGFCTVLHQNSIILRGGISSLALRAVSVGSFSMWMLVLIIDHLRCQVVVSMIEASLLWLCSIGIDFSGCQPDFEGEVCVSLVLYHGSNVRTAVFCEEWCGLFLPSALLNSCCVRVALCHHCSHGSSIWFHFRLVTCAV